MAIGVTRSANYTYVGATGALNGQNNGTIGTPETDATTLRAARPQLGGSVVLYSVNAQANLAAQDDAANEAFSAILRVFPSIICYYAHATSGIIGIVCDGVNAPDAAALEAALDAVGTVNGFNVAACTVSVGTSFVVSPAAS